MRSEKLHGYLMDWSQDVLQEIEGVYPSASPLWKIMMGLSPTPSVTGILPGDWKYWQLGRLNMVILSLPLEGRNAIVAKYLLGLKGEKFWEKLQTSKSGAYRRLAESLHSLNQQLDISLGRN